MSLQGEVDASAKREKVTAFQKTLVLWRDHFENGCLKMHPLLLTVSENNASVSPIKPSDISVWKPNFPTYLKITEEVSAGFEPIC